MIIKSQWKCRHLLATFRNSNFIVRQPLLGREPASSGRKIVENYHCQHNIMATPTDSTLAFFTKATPAQWSYIFSQYKEVLKAKAARRTKKGGPEELIRLDTWYQEQLPKIIHSRKELHITHEELVQITKWKLMRGRFRPNLIDLVRINTETAVLQNSKKAFKRLPNLSGAIGALTNLKGVGPASASAILAAGFPEHAPYMADECMLSTPGVETMDYTMAEYLNYAEQIKKRSDCLNELDSEGKWNPHKIEMALWSHFLARELKPSLLTDLPPADLPATPNGKNKENSDKDRNADSLREDAHPKTKEPISQQHGEDSSDSISNNKSGDNSSDEDNGSGDPDSQSNNSRASKDDSVVEPPPKKVCV